MADVLLSAQGIPGAAPRVNRLSFEDLRAALSAGWADFLAIPTQLLFLCVFYPALGLLAARAATDADLTPLVFPMIAGFALVGPLAALGLYELSRRREQGRPAQWFHVFEVLKSPALMPILRLGLALAAVFALWMLAAHAIHAATLGRLPPGTGFFAGLFGTGAGWAMIVIGHGVGFVFAALVLVTTAFAFPRLLDAGGGAREAVGLSLAVARANPREVAAWGAVVALLLMLGSLPLFIGLAVVLPVLGHATWHLYRRAVS